MPKLFGWLPKRRWLRWSIILFGGGFLLLIVLAITGFFLMRQPAVQSRVMAFAFGYQLRQPIPDPPVPSLAAEHQARLATHAGQLKNAAELFVPTHVWDVRFQLTAEEWTGLGPNQITPISAFGGEDGKMTLRNPNASRPGLAGVLGIDFPWSKGTVQFGDRTFTNAGIRFKGNGTFLSGMASYKRPYKVDLDHSVEGQKLVSQTTLNFGNLLAENSMLTDTLGYEFYREAGVPTIRTTFARVLLSIDGRFKDRLLGLFLLAENPDKKWIREAFGAEGVAVLKPVTYEPFVYLGTNWQHYEEAYNPKTSVSDAQQQRLIDLARLCTEGKDSEFAQQIGEYLDLAKVATWFACEITLANYDGILTTGQNYLLYHDPRSNQFSFGPWDLDHSWGEFPFTGTAADREHASIWKPWPGKNRFFERLLAHAPFKELYRGELERLQTTLFQPERLSRRLDELAAVIRPFVAEESTNRLAKFEQCVAATWPEGPRDGDPFDPNRPAFPLKRFFEARAKSIRAQLAGEETGVEPKGMGQR